MDVQQTNNKPFSVKSTVTSAALGGLAAASLERAFLPAEVKAAVKNTRMGQDAFLKSAKVAAEKTIKNLDKANVTHKINVDKVVANAKEMYPEFAKTAKAANKVFARTFVGVAAAVVLGRTISSLILKSRANKEQ